MMLPIVGIAMAIAVTSIAAIAMQVRNDVRDAGSFEVREEQLIGINQRNREIARVAEVRMQAAEKGRIRAENTAADALAHAKKQAARADAAWIETENFEQCPDSCYSFQWQSD